VHVRVDGPGENVQTPRVDGLASGEAELAAESDHAAAVDGDVGGLAAADEEVDVRHAPILSSVRVLERLDALYALGDKVGYSPAEDNAHRLARGWMEEAGLAVEVDESGNLVGHSGVGEDVWTGSHLDSVPSGGKYDGMLGVVAGIEAVERAGRGSVVVFRDEERGCAGSRGRVASRRLPRRYVELHVEQGPVLLEKGHPLAVVTAIAGIVRGELVTTGRGGHAGTVPMPGRSDALVEAAELVLRVRDTAAAIEGAVATVGRVDVHPGALNVIPDRVAVSVDARAPDAERFQRLVDALGLEPSYRVEPVAMAGPVQDALRAAIRARRLPVVELVSGAGHDAGILAAAGVESGMLFVRSRNGGVSHHPDELTSDDDVALAVDVLADVLANL
jgi:acetylornithine deacetylase/succinyl-diaminopimelate desuccinylase-like protein